MEEEEEEEDFVWFCQHCWLVSRSGWADINAQPTHPLQPDHLVLTIVNADKYGSPNYQNRPVAWLPLHNTYYRYGWSIIVDSFGPYDFGPYCRWSIIVCIVHNSRTEDFLEDGKISTRPF